MNEMRSAPRWLPRLPWAAAASFSGERGEFRRLVARGAVLELISFGFYRFWLVTDMRRHIWSNTCIDGDAAEYTGTAKELLIGFLIALAIIVPVYLVYFLVTFEAERLADFASVPFLLLSYAFGQFAVYRARRYRLTRTVWRGVRFWMDGSGWGYAVRASLWTLLTLLTLGLALPWRAAALERYKMRHSFYGDLRGSFEGRGWDFFRRGWGVWLLAVLLLAVLLLATAAVIQLTVYHVIPMILAATILCAAFRAIEWRWWISGLRFGGVSFECSIRLGDIVGVYLKVFGWGLLLALLLLGYIVLCLKLMASMSELSLHAFTFGTGAWMESIPLLVLIGIGYLVVMVPMNVVIRIYLFRDIWARVVTLTSAYGIEAAVDVAGRGEPASAVGEGLADSIDFTG